ncbi:MAG: hypothetical protein NTZ77_03725 [Caldiserica bacterium]|nr:hypothetical protein [Caldisericota bacterium]
MVQPSTARRSIDRDIPLIVGEGATVGHSAVLHGCSIDHHAMVGMHATVLTGAAVGDETVVAAAALVPENRVVPAQSLSMGVPARTVRPLTDDEIQELHRRADDYVRLGVTSKANPSTRLVCTPAFPFSSPSTHISPCIF